MHKIPVIIFGDRTSAYGVIRALCPSQIPIYIVSQDGKGLCTHSRFVKRVLVLNTDHKDFIYKLLSWISQYVGNEAVFMVAGDDSYLDILSQHRGIFDTHYKCTFPAWEIVEKVRKKRETYKIAQEIGIPIPETHFIRSERELHEILSTGPEIRYPVLMKSEKSKCFKRKYGIKGVVANNKKEVSEKYLQYNGFLGELLLQDMIPGSEYQLLNFIGVYNKNSDPIQVFMNRKRRSSKQFSSCTLMETMWSDKVLEYSNRLIKEIGYVGYANPEYKYDERDGRIKLIEINGRISMSNSHSLCTGTSVIMTMYRDAVEGPLLPLQRFTRNYPDDFLWWMPLDDLIAAIRMFTTDSLKIKDYFNSIRGSGYIVEPFNSCDPFPFLYHSQYLFKALFSFFRQKTKLMSD